MSFIRLLTMNQQDVYDTLILKLRLSFQLLSNVESERLKTQPLIVLINLKETGPRSVKGQFRWE